MKEISQAANEGGLKDGVLEDMLEIVAMVCQRTDKEVDSDWLLDNVDIGTLLAFVKFIFEPLINRVNKMKASEGTSKESTDASGGEETKN